MEKLNVVRVKLVDDAPLLSSSPISSPESAVEIMRDIIGSCDREMFCVLHLNAKGKPLSMSVVSIGELTETSVHPREAFKSSILANAASVIFMHNHPSGDVLPSEDDKRATRRLTDAGNLLGIRVLDHIIVGEGTSDFYSFKGQTVVHPISLQEDKKSSYLKVNREKEKENER